jgi:hypothetical protein
MPDREKIIRALECCLDIVRSGRWASGCITCPYDVEENNCREKMILDAIAMLKEQDEQIRIKTENFNRLVAKIGVMPKIVRCRDCRYGEPVMNGAGDDCIQCNNDDLWLDGNLNFPDWYCADGERRTGYA